jgi:hypothetical protein
MSRQYRQKPHKPGLTGRATAAVSTAVEAAGLAVDSPGVMIMYLHYPAKIYRIGGK